MKKQNLCKDVNTIRVSSITKVSEKTMKHWELVNDSKSIYRKNGVLYTFFTKYADGGVSQYAVPNQEVKKVSAFLNRETQIHMNRSSSYPFKDPIVLPNPGSNIVKAETYFSFSENKVIHGNINSQAVPFELITVFGKNRSSCLKKLRIKLESYKKFLGKDSSIIFEYSLTEEPFIDIDPKNKCINYGIATIAIVCVVGKNYQIIAA